MAAWTPLGNWMHFAQLDGGGGLDGAFTLAYKITDDPGELWSSRFIRFKAKDRTAFAGGVKLMRNKFPELLASLKIPPQEAIIVPALGSGEQVASDKGQIPVLGQCCASTASTMFEARALSKNAHSPIHGIFNAAARDAELDKAAYAAISLPVRNVFVLDDFITRGSTQSRIANAIKAANPSARVFGVALAKTDRRAFWGTLDNNHVPAALDGLWQQGEREYQDYLKKNLGAKP